LAGGSDRPLLDVSGLNRPGLLEVVKQGGNSGAVYRTLGREGPAPDKPLQLSQGNVAVIGMNGLRAEINTWDPTGQAVVGEGRVAVAGAKHAWLLWLLVVVFVVALGAYGWRLHRRRLAAARS
jgi:hypothetical protein